MSLNKLFYVLVLTGGFLPGVCQDKKEPPATPVLEKVEFYDLTDALKNPGNVTSLKLNKQAIQTYPADLVKFVNLRELDLSDNGISEIPASISALSHLEALNLSGNNLTVIPENLCGLKSLKILNLSGNKIASGSLACHSNLERLYLNNNSLTAVPAGITEIQSLKTIYLQTNQITELPEKFARMPNLETFMIQLNKIPEEPNIFKATGIVNYIFNPQALNSRVLYKYFYNQPVFTLGEVSASSLENNNEVYQASAPEPVRPILGKWERMKGYAGIRFSTGYAAHKAIKEDDLRDRIVTGSRRFFAYGYEVGIKDFAVGARLSVSQFEYYSYYQNQYRGIADLNVVKLNFYFSKYFAPLSSKARPYIRAGFGFNIDDPGSYYSAINLQARAGIDLYITRLVGLNIETGFGDGNYVSAGLIVRIPWGKYGY
jgi:hypothetical protein